MGFFTINEIGPKPIAEGVEIRIIHGERMTMAFFSMGPGARVPEHAHPHEQMGTVLKGSIELIIGEEKRTITQGDAYHVPSDVIHRGVCGDAPAEVMEVFSPPREDLK